MERPPADASSQSAPSNAAAMPSSDISAGLAAALERLEASRDRLLLAQTRMEMAVEQAEFAFARFGAAADQLGARLRDAELDR